VSERDDPIKTGNRLVECTSGEWVAPRDVTMRMAVILHGFTADALYMVKLADFIRRHEFFCAFFEYNSYVGIEKPALSLAQKLSRLREPLEKHGYVFVAHSMGGLVARCAAQRVATTVPGLRGIAQLGTPNAGTLVGAKKTLLAISAIADVHDALGPANPFARSPVCLSARELTRSDSNGFIDHLNNAERAGSGVPVLSISGGLEHLEFGPSLNGGYRAQLANKSLQAMIGGRPNDGLVPETSSNITSVLGASGDRKHWKDYLEYSNTNHTHLVRNQDVAGRIVDWLMERFP
jgi:pimeloyl-ACP methyl ester carboxylesterase